MIEPQGRSREAAQGRELKALMFPSTLALVVDDASIGLISREAFPNIVSGLNSGAVGGALLAPALPGCPRQCPGSSRLAAR